LIESHKIEKQIFSDQILLEDDVVIDLIKELTGKIKKVLLGKIKIIRISYVIDFDFSVRVIDIEVDRE
jgi:hypothetical protein